MQSQATQTPAAWFACTYRATETGQPSLLQFTGLEIETEGESVRERDRSLTPLVRIRPGICTICQPPTKTQNFSMSVVVKSFGKWRKKRKQSKKETPACSWVPPLGYSEFIISPVHRHHLLTVTYCNRQSRFEQKHTVQFCIWMILRAVGLMMPVVTVIGQNYSLNTSPHDLSFKSKSLWLFFSLQM